MKTHVLAGCGSFMAGLCSIAKELKHDVVAYDRLFQDPMHIQLLNHMIPCISGYEQINVSPTDTVIAGNSISRGIPAIEDLLSRGHRVYSGAGWLSEQVLSRRKTIAIAGTHGKTTTTALTTWLLKCAGETPGHLLGGIANNFSTSATLGKAPYFVIEADEYDTAFFDKRPKFFHYPAHALILNNLEFDHADIYPNFEAIVTQMRHYLLTLVPDTPVIYPQDCPHLSKLVHDAFWLRGIASHADNTTGPWRLVQQSKDWQSFTIYDDQERAHDITWPLMFKHNAHNALHALMVMHALGKSITIAAQHLQEFKGVARRMQSIAHNHPSQVIWDDFAHHPTALKNVLSQLKVSHPHKRLVAYLQLSNYTQRQGIMWKELIEATSDADLIFLQIIPGKFPYESFVKAHPKQVVLLEYDDLTPQFMAPYLEDNDQIISCSSRCCKSFHEAVKGTYALETA